MSTLIWLRTANAEDLKPGEHFAYDEHNVVKIIFVDVCDLGNHPKAPGGRWCTVSVQVAHPVLGRIAKGFGWDHPVHVLQEREGTLEDYEKLNRILERTERDSFNLIEINGKTAEAPKPRPMIRMSREQSLNTLGVPAIRTRR
jgi:hypothetical protein